MATFTNQATLSYNATTVSSNIVTGEVISNLSLIKTALTAVYVPGDIIPYAISITNSGETVFTGLTLTDDLGAYEFDELTLIPLTYVDGSIQLFVSGQPQEAPEVTVDDGLIITGIDVPAGGNAMLLYSARVNEFAPPCGGVIENTVSLGNDCPCADGTASAEIETICEPRLTISKQLCPSVVSRCDEPLTFTFNIRNNSCCPALANANVSVSDTFDPPITITSVTFNGAEWTEGIHYTYDAETGEFVTVPGQVTVPAAVYTRNAETGEWTSAAGESTLVITGVFCTGN